MFALVILNKGFKSKCHFNRFILFCFSSSDQFFFFNRVETFVRFWKGGYLGTFVRKYIYIFDQWLIRTEAVSSFPTKLALVSILFSVHS